VRHNVIHQVLSDRLRAFVKKIALVLANFFKSLGLLFITNLFGSGFSNGITLVFNSFLLVAVVFLFFSSDQISDFVFLDRFLSNFLLLLLLITFDTSFNRGFNTILFSLKGGFSLFSISLSFVKFFKECIISSSDKVEAARLSVLLTESSNHT